LLLRRQTADGETLAWLPRSGAKLRVGTTSTTPIPLSLPLKLAGPDMPVPELPSPVFTARSPDPICRKAGTTLETLPVFGSTSSVKFGSGTGPKYASSAHWKTANPAKSWRVARTSSPSPRTAVRTARTAGSGG
jgi:hypothetical protein